MSPIHAVHPATALRDRGLQPGTRADLRVIDGYAPDLSGWNRRVRPVRRGSGGNAAAGR